MRIKYYVVKSLFGFSLFVASCSRSWAQSQELRDRAVQLIQDQQQSNNDLMKSNKDLIQINAGLLSINNDLTKSVQQMLQMQREQQNCLNELTASFQSCEKHRHTEVIVTVSAVALSTSVVSFIYLLRR